MPDSTLIYLSNGLFDSAGQLGTFFLMERECLSRLYERVYVVCNDGYGVLEETIRLRKPPLMALRACLRAPLRPELRAEWKRLRKAGGSLSQQLRLLAFATRGQRMALCARACLKACDAKQTTLYAFWLSFDAYAAALCKRETPSLCAVARCHAFDIDLKRNDLNPYLMKAFICDTLDRIYPISERALALVTQCMGAPPPRARVVWLGSRGAPVGSPAPAPYFHEGVLRLVSCATVLPIKRVPLLVEALAAWTGCEVEWLHIGGDEAALRALAHETLDGCPLVRYELAGALEPEEIERRYQAKAYDLFINTSVNEGVPVTVMEALRFGIPAVVPRVGGIPELVDESVGFLYDADDCVQGVLAALRAYVAMDGARAEGMRRAAQALWLSRCRNEALLAGMLRDTSTNERR